MRVSIVSTLHGHRGIANYTRDLVRALAESGAELETVAEDVWKPNTPSYPRSRWSLTSGKSSDHLEPLLRRIGPVDIFLHDSDHSYENMQFEFRTIV